jgi:hypothetical protein
MSLYYVGLCRSLLKFLGIYHYTWKCGSNRAHVRGFHSVAHHQLTIRTGTSIYVRVLQIILYSRKRHAT